MSAKNKTFFISGGSRFGEQRVFTAYGFTEVSLMDGADIVVFTGGADINPEIYGEKPHPYTSYMPSRDAREIADYRLAKAKGKAILGICRGAQLMNCMVGGTLFQHINHPSFHEIVTDEGERFMSNSVHHQMLRVGPGAIIKAWAEDLSNVHEYMEGGHIVNVENVEKEPEIVIYPEHRMVLVQGHPEFNSTDVELSRFREFVFQLLENA